MYVANGVSQVHIFLLGSQIKFSILVTEREIFVCNFGKGFRVTRVALHQRWEDYSFSSLR